MSIIYFCPGKDDSCRKVKRVIEIIVAAEKCEVFHKLKEFENYVRSSLSHQDIIILQASDMKNLRRMTALKELLSDQRIILILPEGKPETIALGHTLRPRFVTYQDSDFLDMAAVLCNMLRPANAGAHVTLDSAPLTVKSR